MALPTLDQPTAYDIAEKSAYEISYLQDHIRVGFTSERGPAWWAADKKNPLADGTHFDGPVPLNEVERMLDIVLEERPLFYQDTDGSYKPVTKFKGIGIVGRDDVVNVPRESYQIHQYMGALHSFIAAITDGVQVGSVGVLKHGAVAFLQAVLPKDYEVAGYGYTPYITAATSCDSSVANTYGTGAKGAVCDNTLDMAVAGFLTKYKIKHTRNSKARAQAARDALGIQLVQVAEDMGSVIDGLLKVEVSERDFELWLDEIVPMPEPQERTLKSGRASGPGKGYTMAENKRDELNRLWTKDAKVKPWAGTAFGILQASNTWTTWESTVRNAAGGRIERNYLNMVEGKVASSDRKALDALAKVQERKLTLV